MNGEFVFGTFVCHLRIEYFRLSDLKLKATNYQGLYLLNFCMSAMQKKISTDMNWEFFLKLLYVSHAVKNEY